MTWISLGSKNFSQRSIFTSDLQPSWGHFAPIPLSNFTSTCCFIQERQYLWRQPSTENIWSTSLSSKQITQVSFKLLPADQVTWVIMTSFASLNASLISLRATRDGLQYVNLLRRIATWSINSAILLCLGRGNLPKTYIQKYGVTNNINKVIPTNKNSKTWHCQKWH